MWCRLLSSLSAADPRLVSYPAPDQLRGLPPATKRPLIAALSEAYRAAPSYDLLLLLGLLLAEGLQVLLDAYPEATPTDLLLRLGQVIERGRPALLKSVRQQLFTEARSLSLSKTLSKALALLGRSGGASDPMKQRRIKRALATLTEEEQQLTKWLFLEEHTQAEVSALLGVSIATLERRVASLRPRLAEALKDIER